MMIIKRNGQSTPLDEELPNRVVLKACEGISGVSASEVLTKAKLQFVDGMTTERIQEILIKSAEQLIDVDNSGYQYVASRLQMYDIRKRAYGQYHAPSFYDHYKKMAEKGIYDAQLLEAYTRKEFDKMESFICHKRDLNFSYAATGQLVDKYLLRDRTQYRAFYESPQMMYMAIAATLLQFQPKERRMMMVKRFYDGASQFKFSLPTPIMAGVRTPTRQFSSCVLIRCGDSLNAINATASSIVNYVSKRAGIGIDASSMRSVGSPIRNGEMEHTGILPFLKYHVAALKSCSQGGIRGGAATVYYPMWHLEYENIIVLKNNRGIEENRERRVDYGIQMNGELIRRYLNNEPIWLLDPSEVPNVYKSFYENNQEFAEEYEKACQMAEAGLIRGKKKSAHEVFDMFISERIETGRIYVQFVDNTNEQGPFDPYIDPIYQSNLCAEIALPTREFESLDDESGRIALCTLASFNMSEFLHGDLDEMMEYADVLVSALDGLLEYQDYPQIQAKIATREFRTLGIGIVNLADFLMKHGVEYGSSKALEIVNKWMEKFSYALTTASVNQAERFGPCERWKDTCYGSGTFPFELRKETIDKLVSSEHECDWDTLRVRLLQHGIRNATLSAVAPTESSSQILNATNGVEMPKGPMSIKASKSGMFKQIVPDPTNIDNYQYLWNNSTPTEYLYTVAVIQKWIDQSISTNTFYHPERLGGSISKLQAMKDIILFYSLGGKTLYYNNLNDGAGDVIDDEPECSSCVV